MFLKPFNLPLTLSYFAVKTNIITRLAVLFKIKALFLMLIPKFWEPLIALHLARRFVGLFLVPLNTLGCRLNNKKEKM